MTGEPIDVREATVTDAATVARLLHDFNTEYGTPTPEVDTLTRRLEVLLAGDATVALLAGDPAVGMALVTRRPNVWYAGPVALLDELYVVPEHRSHGIGSAIVAHLISTSAADGVGLIEINVDESDIDAQRFYERHGFARTEPDSDERAFYYWRELERSP